MLSETITFLLSEARGHSKLFEIQAFMIGNVMVVAWHKFSKGNVGARNQM